MTGDHPAPTGDHPAPTSDHPAPTSDHPAPTSDHPAPTGDHPASTSDHPAPTGNHPDCIPNPNLPYLTPEVPIIDPGFPIDYTITTGRTSRSLFANGIVSLLWGIALAVFSSGVVPVTWVISQYGKKHPEIINTITALIGTASTTHLTYTFQGILEHYSYYVLVDGFTLRQLNWMQGVKEWSFFTVLQFESYWKRLVWLVIYLSMALHSASVVSVLQPSMSYNFLIFFDSIFMDYVQTPLS